MTFEINRNKHVVSFSVYSQFQRNNIFVRVTQNYKEESIIDLKRCQIKKPKNKTARSLTMIECDVLYFSCENKMCSISRFNSIRNVNDSRMTVSKYTHKKNDRFK